MYSQQFTNSATSDLRPLSAQRPIFLSRHVCNLEAAANAMEFERDESLCKYNGGSCPNERAIRSLKHGLLRFCEYHQRRANSYQKKYLQRQQQRRPPLTTESEPVASPVPPAVAAAPFVVFVVARETNIVAPLLRAISAGELVSTGQPISAVARESNDGLLDMLLRVGSDEAIRAAVGPHSSLAMSTTTVPAHTHSDSTHVDELNSLLVLPSTDTESLPSLDDSDWLSRFLDE
jgi:hypothetical protein